MNLLIIILYCVFYSQCIISSPIPTNCGGTGKISLTAYAILAGGTTNTGPMQQVSGTGTSGQALTSIGGGLPTWQNDGNTATTNGCVFITTLTASNSSSLSFTSSHLSSTYKIFMIVLNNLAPTSTTVSLQALWSTNDGPLSSGYSSGVNYIAYTGTSFTNVNSTTNIILGATTSFYYSGILYLYGANGALTSGPALTGITASSYPPVYGNVIATISGTPTINNMSFQFSSGNISSGSISLYGLA